MRILVSICGLLVATFTCAADPLTMPLWDEEHFPSITLNRETGVHITVPEGTDISQFLKHYAPRMCSDVFDMSTPRRLTVYVRANLNDHEQEVMIDYRPDKVTCVDPEGPMS